ncbi:MAG: hypothetical protein LBU88_03805 [Treponema sp.]|jgi:hypothetical protein|nr:hypothetical protein [Treponema sp.]
MAVKKWFALTGMFLLFTSLIFAQADTEQAPEAAQNYYIDRSERDPRFIQRLLWDKADHALRYELILEQLGTNGRYSEIERVSVEEAFAEVSLRVGNYRYRVEVYDFFDELAFSTEWREFSIIRAIQPGLTSFYPSAFYLDDDEEWVINLRGQNLLPESEIYLKQDNRIIRPQSHDSNGSSSRLVFSEISLAPGKYVVYVRNPGGLDASMGTFTISYKKLHDLNISLGYAPIAPLYGFLFKDFTWNTSEKLDAPFPDSFYFLGAAAKINFIIAKRSWGFLGVEASASFTYMQHKKDDYTSEALFLNTHLSLLYQKYIIKNVFAINIILGGGFVTLLDFYYEYPVGTPTEKTNSFIPSAIAGFSAVLFFSKPFYINAGADFIQMFPPDNPLPGFLRPFLTVGVWL